ncbi:methylated-DNA-[protein]-cysteine S-methyltransferase [Seinonella peptonophila]|uniref:Methylated-DNA--protein-cysteine methyltransferase n=1 Tax=Seinonella peptonophila TaxID=112248 RepID=A0A1M4VHC6_9BACL|nr:methylated-DNA--[protein]-cysteine S-methyltransferase [Seinonella peptonophila]SHE68348.1 methylated-DNA-[protein]-cysteine S-methyltransferase [Seinonella peptonophila]
MAQERFVWDVWDSPVSRLVFVVSTQGLYRLQFSSQTSLALIEQELLDILPSDSSLEYDQETVAPFLQQVKEYFAHKRKTFDLPLHMVGTSFQRSTWEALQQIPFGQVCSYKDIAVRIGNPKAVRAIGGANNRNPIPIIVPCHRVCGANGDLVGFGSGIDRKQFLLEHEGFVIEKNRLMEGT